MAVLDDASAIEDENAFERCGLANVVRDAQQRCLGPPSTNLDQEPAALFVIHAAKRLVEDDEAGRLAHQCSAQADTLSFASGHETAAFTEESLQAVGQTRQDRAQIGSGQDRWNMTHARKEIYAESAKNRGAMSIDDAVATIQGYFDANRD